ncbi:MAG: putative glycerophosphoryl diester phosphodiesterase 1, partial [Planctomycetota bacterium]
LTSDGQIVCVHDADTERVAGVRHVVAETPLAELRALDAGRWKAEQFAGERLPTFAEVLAAVPAGKRFFIELKEGPAIVPQVVAGLQGWEGDPALLTIIAFNADTVAACKRALPAIKAHWLTGFKQDKATGEWQPSAAEVVASFKASRADGVGLKGERQVVDRGFLEQLRAGGVPEFHVWTIDAPEDARAFREFGAVGITTNRPALIRAALADEPE